MGLVSPGLRCCHPQAGILHFLLLAALQVDKKIVRTEIGVLLRLSHPNIVSKAFDLLLPAASEAGPCPC